MKTIIFIFIAGILFFAYRKVADYNYKEGYFKGSYDYYRKMNPIEDKNNTSIGYKIKWDTVIIGTSESKRQKQARHAQIFIGTGTLKSMPHDE